jgi:hypothetical protein
MVRVRVRDGSGSGTPAAASTLTPSPMQLFFEPSAPVTGTRQPTSAWTDRPGALGQRSDEQAGQTKIPNVALTV